MKKNKLIDNEIYSKSKDYSRERHKVITYFEIGKLLSEAGSKYGENIMQKYANKLVVCYINICIEQNLSKRDLQKKIKLKEYQRLYNNTKNKLINKEKEKIEDFIKNPILIKNSYNEEISEKILKRLILEDIGNFLKELGNGFSYIDSEYKIKIGERLNFIDLLLFNYIYNAFVVVELKITEIKVEHIAQIKKYMNYIDKNVKNVNQDNIIGIVICKKDNIFVLKRPPHLKQKTC